MAKRYVSIWFRHLATDWMIRRRPELANVPFVMAKPERGRMVVTATNAIAQAKGVFTQMVVADCRALIPELQVFDDQAGLDERLLTALAEWCIRFTPHAGIDLPDGLILDATGCTHLWRGEELYLKDIANRLSGFRYNVRVAMADTIGCAWAVCRHGNKSLIIPSGKQLDALKALPPVALRLDTITTDRLQKLGLYHIGDFIAMPRQPLRRRFGQALLSRLDQALGQEIEVLQPVRPIEPYQERLPSLDPIRTATGIEIALRELLEKLCTRLSDESKGLRSCVFKCYRIDSNLQQISIGTTRPSRNVEHLFKLFEVKIGQIEPDLGIELFVLDAPVVEELTAAQDALWNTTGSKDNIAIAELLDKIAGKVGQNAIHRYLPDERHWPENSIKLAKSLDEEPTTQWRTDLPRPVHLLPTPEPIDVMVAIPDYPPVSFRYKGKLYQVNKADGPERIEQEWWIAAGQFRDYYCIEDKEGKRYWLFRSGHYSDSNPKWYIHGFFA